MFRGKERGLTEIWYLVRFHVSLWASISKNFCNYSLGSILLSWSPFFVSGVVLVSKFFLYALVFFHFFLNESCFHKNYEDKCQRNEFQLVDRQEEKNEISNSTF